MDPIRVLSVRTHLYSGILGALHPRFDCRNGPHRRGSRTYLPSLQYYPWRGGYSAVNFYEALRHRVPKEDRPAIQSIRYESPGWIELGLVVAVALNIKYIIKALTTGAKEINSTYHEIYKGMQDRKLTDLDIKRKEIELSRDQRQFARESAEELAQQMHFGGMEQLAELTDNEVVALKILLSIYRRSRDLSKIEEQGRIRF